jgi:hypothetical protein
MAHPEDLPGTPVTVGDEDHIIDHEKIRTALYNVDNRLYSAEQTLPNKADAHNHPYAASSHTHLASGITDFNTAVRTNRLDQMATPTVPVAFGGVKLTGLGAPTASTDAATKAYVDSNSSGGVSSTPANVINVLENGVKRDCRVNLRFTTIANNTTITCTSSPYSEGSAIFTSEDVGKTVWIDKATSGGNYDPHRSTIVSIGGGGTTAVLASAPTRSLTNANGLVGTDNTSAINAICASLQAWDQIWWPGGKYGYFTDGGHVINAGAIRMFGEQLYSSLFVMVHRTNSLFSFGVNSGGNFIERLVVEHQAKNTNDAPYSGGNSGNYWDGSRNLQDAPSAPTSGAAFFHSAGGGYSTYSHVAVTGMYVGFNSAHGSMTTWHFCEVTNPVYAGFIVENPEYPDWGGCRIIECKVQGSARQYMGQHRYGVLWTGGGGFTIRGGDYAGAVEAIVIQPANNCHTSQIRIDGTGVEDWGDAEYPPGGVYRYGGNADKYGIHVNLINDTVDLLNVTITGNNIASVLHGGTKAIGVTSVQNTASSRSGNGAGVGGLVVANNSGYATGAAVTLTWVKTAYIAGNPILTASANSFSNCTSIDTGV